MKDTPVEGTYRKLFEGTLQNVIQCDNINFESLQDEHFSTLNLMIKDYQSIEESLRSYVAIERLEG